MTVFLFRVFVLGRTAILADPAKENHFFTFQRVEWLGSPMFYGKFPLFRHKFWGKSTVSR